MSKKIVEEALSKKEQKDLWAAGYRPALPITPGYFSLGSVLPAVLYMMRWGHRRGSGKFSSGTWEGSYYFKGGRRSLC